MGVVNAVLFDAADIQLVAGPPAGRRRYLDILISQMDRSYLRALQRYQKVVYQRNHLLRLLRDGRARTGEIDFWNEAIVQEGSFITLRRHEVIKDLRNMMEEVHCQLTGNQEELTADYASSIPLDALNDAGVEDIRLAFERTLEAGRDRELALGSSQWGPHRDDVRLMLGGMETATYSSRGQARTVAIALRLAEGMLLEKERRESLFSSLTTCYRSWTPLDAIVCWSTYPEASRPSSPPRTWSVWARASLAAPPSFGWRTVP